MEVLVVMAIGVAIGATIFPEWLKTINENLTVLTTALLIFAMGVTLGARPTFLEELGTVGFSSVMFCLLPVFFSTLFVYILTRIFMKDIIARHKHDAQEKQEQGGSNGEVVLIALSLAALIGGVLYGMSQKHFYFLDLIPTHSDLILYFLMIFVGVSVGMSRGLVAKIKQYHIKTFIIPAGVLVGTILGGFLAALICGISLPTGAAIASGLGWYSLSGVMLTGIAGAQIGSITFLSSLMREIVSYFSIPLIARHLNYPTCIAPAGATSEDTTLPMMIRCTNEETVVLSVVNGVVCSIMVPILIEFFHLFI